MSRSEFIGVRGLRYHLRRWGDASAPLLVMTHGWLDVSATFDPVAQRLAARGLQVLMPDWRGFGDSEWPQDGYWFPDYVADLDAVVDQCAPGAPILLAGHSMGAQVVSIYAGLRPSRVRRLAILDGLFLPDSDLRTAPKAYARWLDDVRIGSRAPTYASHEALADRVQKHHPYLSAERCAFVARCWGELQADGRVHLRSDPRHLLTMPRLYRQAESDAIWAQITAETLFVDGTRSSFAQGLPAEEIARRRALFRQHRAAVIEGAGHMLHFEAPEALARVLADFFLAEPDRAQA